MIPTSSSGDLHGVVAEEVQRLGQPRGRGPSRTRRTAGRPTTGPLTSYASHPRRGQGGQSDSPPRPGVPPGRQATPRRALPVRRPVVRVGSVVCRRSSRAPPDPGLQSRTSLPPIRAGPRRGRCGDGGPQPVQRRRRPGRSRSTGPASSRRSARPPAAPSGGTTAGCPATAPDLQVAHALGPAVRARNSASRCGSAAAISRPTASSNGRSSPPGRCVRPDNSPTDASSMREL